MAKKRLGGLSRKKLQKLERLSRLSRIKLGISGSKLAPQFFVEEHPGEPIKVVVKPVAGAKVATGGVVIKNLRKGIITQRYATAGRKRSIASVLVEASSKSVIDDLGIKIIEVTAKPETVHVLGSMVAERAMVMARSLGRYGGGILDSIGDTSVDFSIDSSSGKVSTRVTPKADRRREVAAAEADESFVEVPVEVPVKKKKEKKEKPTVADNITTKTDAQGIIHVHIHSLVIYINATHVDQLNTNPGLVQNIIANPVKGITGDTNKKVVVEVENQKVVDKKDDKEEDSKDQEEDDSKKKPKKKKKKGEDDDKK